LGQQDALSGVGTTIMFNVDTRDAQFLIKDLQSKVKPQDISELTVGEAIARIETEIVRIKTPSPLIPLQPSYKEKIINLSHQRYCRPASDVKKRIRSSRENWITDYVPELDTNKRETFPLLEYDEFE